MQKGKPAWKRCFQAGLTGFLTRTSQTTHPSGPKKMVQGGLVVHDPGGSRGVFSADAGAAADGDAAEADGAGTAGLAAGSQALAAALGQLAAVFVTGSAGDAHPLRGRFAGATAEAEIALGDADPVLRAGAAAHSLGEAPAEVLECAAGGLIGAFAVDLEAISALFESQRAAGHGAPGRSRANAVLGRAMGRNVVRTGGGTVRQPRTHGHSVRHGSLLCLSPGSRRGYRRGTGAVLMHSGLSGGGGTIVRRSPRRQRRFWPLAAFKKNDAAGGALKAPPAVGHASRSSGHRVFRPRAACCSARRCHRSGVGGDPPAAKQSGSESHAARGEQGEAPRLRHGHEPEAELVIGRRG